MDTRLQDGLQDFRLALRLLFKRPAFTAIAVLTLVLGIGANTAIFTVVNAVLLRPLPYADPEQLVRVWESNEQQGKVDPPSPANFLDFKEQNQVFSEITFWQNASFTIEQEAGRPEELSAVRVAPNFFALLGTVMAHGRAFADAEGRDALAVIGAGLWQRRFGSDPTILGKTMLLDGTPHTVVGVLPLGFAMPNTEVEVWTPLEFAPNQMRFRRNLGVIARLRPGISLAQADADLDRVAAGLEQAYPRSNTGYRVTLVPLQEDVIGDAQKPLLVLFGAVGLVLLIACANVAALLLARATRREREIAIRGALGAGRLSLVRQLLAESIVLGLLAGLLSLLAAHWGLQLLLALEPGDLPRLHEVGIDARVLVFTLGLSLLTSLVFGLAPALKAARPNLLLCLKEGTGQGSTGGKQHHLGLRVLTAAEVALAVMLLVGAGLLIRSFVRLQKVDPGFDPKNVLVARIALDNDRYPETAQRVVYFDRLLATLGALPGVRQVAATSTLPLSSAGIDFDLPFRGEGQPEMDPAEAPQADFRIVSADYFAALGIALRSGRTFSSQDRAETLPVAVINETLARQVWPGQPAVGKKLTLYFGQPPREMEVVGVVADTRHQSLAIAPRPQLFVPLAQVPRFTFLSVVLKTESDPQLLFDAVRDGFLAVDPSEPASGLTTMTQVVADSLARERFLTSLLSLLASAALVLAAIGIYGLMAYSVSERTQEIGVRMALGAHRNNVLQLIVRQGTVLAGLGILGGLLGAWALSSLLGSLLYGIPPRDATTFVSVSSLLLAVALIACSVPAARAARIDPIRALRNE